MITPAHVSVLDADKPVWKSQAYDALFFLLIWPAINTLIIASAAGSINSNSTAVLSAVGVRFFPLFAAAYTIILLLRWRFSALTDIGRFWPQLALHLIVFFTLARVLSIFVERPLELAEVPAAAIIPAILLATQITLYVLVRSILARRSHYFLDRMNAKQAELAALRAQSNPHFLFNTLNLLASEIARDPDAAREIVYDLADLLRESMSAAQRDFITVREELRLSKLYLALQQKRFSDRLSHSVTSGEAVDDLLVPSLLLQPVVENAIKHAIAPHARPGSVHVNAASLDGKLRLTVRDSGPAIEAGDIVEGEGFRILRTTLALRFQQEFSLNFDSTPEGSLLVVELPLARLKSAGTATGNLS